MVRTQALSRLGRWLVMLPVLWLWALLWVSNDESIIGRLAFTLPWALIPWLVVVAFTRKREPYELSLLSAPFLIALGIIAALALAARA